MFPVRLYGCIVKTGLVVILLKNWIQSGFRLLFKKLGKFLMNNEHLCNVKISILSIFLYLAPQSTH